MRVRDGLPSGLVTFVITDIEGSTKLLRRLGDRYPSLLDTHNSVLREQWLSHGGVEVNTAGDSFVVAFQSAGDALAASVAAQRVIAGGRWPEEAVVRIRIGVHTGIAFHARGYLRGLGIAPGRACGRRSQWRASDRVRGHDQGRRW